MDNKFWWIFTFGILFGALINLAIAFYQVTKNSSNTEKELQEMINKNKEKNGG